jgi:hypothetical protein
MAGFTRLFKSLGEQRFKITASAAILQNDDGNLNLKGVYFKVINLIRHICVHTTSFVYITRSQNNNKVKVRFKITALVAILSKIQNSEGGGCQRH